MFFRTGLISSYSSVRYREHENGCWDSLLSLPNGKFVLSLEHVNCWWTINFFIILHSLKWNYEETPNTKTLVVVTNLSQMVIQLETDCYFFVVTGFLFRVSGGDVVRVSVCACRLRGVSNNAFGRCAIFQNQEPLKWPACLHITFFARRFIWWFRDRMCLVM